MHPSNEGRRLGSGRSLGYRVAREVNGMVLAQAFVVVRSAGFKLVINKNNGVHCNPFSEKFSEQILVDVVDGVVSRARLG